MESMRSLKDRTSGFFSFFALDDREAVVLDGFTHLVNVTGDRWQKSLVVSGSFAVRAGLDSASLELLRDGSVVLSLPFQSVADSIGTAPRGRHRAGRTTVASPSQTWSIDKRAPAQSAGALRLIDVLMPNLRPLEDLTIVRHGPDVAGFVARDLFQVGTTAL